MIPENVSPRLQTVSYVGNMRNIAFITGFVRKPSKTGFFVQQSNNLALAVPITLPPGARVPREFDPVTVTAHVYGRLRDDGVRITEIRAFKIETPSTRSMPPFLAWNTKIPDHVTADAFRPFKKDGNLESEIATQLQDGELSEGEAAMLSIMEATSGKLDTEMATPNLVSIAGFVEAAAIVRGNDYQRDHLGILIRQLADASKSIPVRLYANDPELLKKHLNTISVGWPARIDGIVRSKLVLSEDGKDIVDHLVYVRCSKLKIAVKGEDRDIKAIPDWLAEMKERILEQIQRRKNREAVAVEQASAASE